jgi:putative transposase
MRRAKVRDLKPVEPIPAVRSIAEADDLADIKDADWQRACERFEMMRPLLETPDCTRVLMHAPAASVGRHPATLYRWIQQYRRTGRLSTLVPAQRGVRAGPHRLDSDVEAVLATTIDEVYLSPQKRSVSYTAHEVARRCRNAGLQAPDARTIRRRIKALSDKERLRGRQGGRAVRDKYAPIHGAFPDADWPLAVVPIDHTLVDLILVDDVSHRPVGRPWMTLALDVFSRMVAGFAVSFDPPGAMAVGLCLAQAILPKDTWLTQHHIATPWPVWGVMSTVHADNGKEFRGTMLRKACQAYGMHLHWRPVARPHFGGHIERLLGTLKHEIHNLPGSTFTNPQARGASNSDQHAGMTWSELERWRAITIVEISHQRRHREIGTTPLQKYEEGIFGSAEHSGRGLPDRLLDEARLRLDFMPYAERTVQPHGSTIDEIHYYDDMLRPWISATGPSDGRGKRKRKFIIRREPRDSSRVYCYDPELKQYFEIPYRHTAHPPISVWELREARCQLKDEGQKAVNEALLFDAYKRMLIIDEVHNILTGPVTTQRQFLNVLKYLGNDLPSPLVGLGTREALRAIQADPQLANRFEPAAVPRWQLHQEFQMLLASFERALPLRAVSRLADAPLARQLLAWSEGSLGELSAGLTTAAVSAVTSGVEGIDAQVLAAITWVPPSERRRQAERLV